MRTSTGMELTVPAQADGRPGSVGLGKGAAEKVMRARVLKGEISQAEAYVRDCRKELKVIEDGFRARLQGAGVRIGTFCRRPLVVLSEKKRASYVVEENVWNAVEYL